MTRRLLWPGIVGTVFVLIVAAINFNANMPDIDRHHAIVDRIQVIKQVNVSLDEELYEVMSRKHSHYDSLSQTNRQLPRSFDQLVHGKADLASVADPVIQQHIAQLEAAIEEKGRLVENIKTDHSLLHNSLEYYPFVSREVEPFAQNLGLAEGLDELARLVMYYLMNGERSWFSKANSRLDALKRLVQERYSEKTRGYPHIKNFLAHSQLIIDARARQLAPAAIEKKVPVKASIVALQQAYMQHYSAQVSAAEKYRYAMMMASLLLVGGLAYAMLLLARNAKELAASRAKSVFLANMSHEIRTPLTAIIGFGEATLEGGQSMQERLTAVRSIVKNGKHLLSVINEILDISKIESGKMEVEILPIDVPELLSDIVSVVSLQTAEKGLIFELYYDTPVPDKIHADAVRLKQILLNVCINAVKFTYRGRVELRVSCQAEAERITFSVLDTGIGISKEQMARLFKPFSQADATTTRRFGGTGLGLYISRELTKHMGGDVHMSSRVDEGTRVDVVIACGPLDGVAFSDAPHAPAHMEAESRGAANVPCLTGEILLAEDSIDNQRLIAYQVRKTGATMVFADNGKLALEQALERPFDLILMDMQMPEMDGLQATRRLREAGYEQPIVALTANAFEEDVDKSRQAGCDDFLSKPVDWGQFFEILEKYLAPGAETASEEVPSDETPLVSEMLDGDPEVEAFIISLIDELPVWLEAIESCYRQQAWEDLQGRLHKLKGTVGSFGYPQVGELAARMEHELKAGDLDPFDTSLVELKRLIARIIKGRPD